MTARSSFFTRTFSRTPGLSCGVPVTYPDCVLELYLDYRYSGTAPPPLDHPPLLLGLKEVALPHIMLPLVSAGAVQENKAEFDLSLDGTV